jgi:hypothetical protein
MESLGGAFTFDMNNAVVITCAFLFAGLIVFFLVKFFKVFFEFFQAKGCLTVVLIALVGLPGIVALSLVAGYTFTSAILILFAVIGVLTGYIARDSEENVGRFGNFIFVVSLFTLIIALFLIKLL